MFVIVIKKGVSNKCGQVGGETLIDVNFYLGCYYGPVTKNAIDEKDRYCACTRNAVYR